MRIVLERIIKNSLKQQINIKSQQRFKSKKHNVFTEEVNKIALSANDEKRT